MSGVRMSGILARRRVVAMITMMATIPALFGCAPPSAIEISRPLLGDWQANNGVLVSIRQTADYGIAAVVKETPGIRREGMTPGSPVIAHITPLGNGVFRGEFIMPDGGKPVPVRLGFSSPRTLVVGSWDERTERRMMEWSRLTP